MTSARLQNTGEGQLETTEAEAPRSILDAVDAPSAVPQVRQTYGLVESTEGGRLSIRVGAKTVVAARAASCLLEPDLGDQVLIATTDVGPSFILAVLVQGAREKKTAVLSLEGDVTLKAPSGKISMVAKDMVSIASASQVAVSAPELSVHALKTNFFSDSLSYIGRKVEGEVEKIKVAAQVLDTVVDRVTQRVKRSYRTIEEIEHVKAKELDVVVEGNVSIHSDNTLVSADKLVKVDGEQVHLG